MKFSEFVARSKETGLPLPRVILEREEEKTGVPREKLRQYIGGMLETMLEEANKKYGKRQRTLTGMTGSNGYLMRKASPKMISSFNHTAMVAALSMAESNAAMGRVVACPTAGSCGVLSGILYSLWKLENASKEELIDAFIVAGGVGWVISRNATLSGAEGGCQAEIGSATAMAAAALTYYFSRDGMKCSHAAALALKSLMGLVCDPVGGFVEVPCVKRNGIATNIAIAAAEMALAGIESVIPFDEVVEAMRRVGRSLPESLRETGKGGIAATPTARRLVEKLREKNGLAMRQ